MEVSPLQEAALLSEFYEDESCRWKGREVSVSSYSSWFKESQPALKTIRALRVSYSEKCSQDSCMEWNYDCHPIPPGRITVPVPDAETCRDYARGLRFGLMRWIREEEKFVQRKLMSEHQVRQIQGILNYLLDEVENYCNISGLYAAKVDWKEVLQPLYKTYWFWKQKWKLYGVPPNPNDYPLR
jgi:hypothetical protein